MDHIQRKLYHPLVSWHSCWHHCEFHIPFPIASFWSIHGDLGADKGYGHNGNSRHVQFPIWPVIIKRKVFTQEYNQLHRFKKKTFTSCLKQYRVIHVPVEISKQALNNFVQVAMVMGVLLAPFGGFACIKLWDNLPTLIYLGISVFFPFALCVQFMFVRLFAVLSTNAQTQKLQTLLER